jgi:hypothetical protein
MVWHRTFLPITASLILAPIVIAASRPADGVILLPMDGFVAVPLPPTKDVVVDTPFHMYRVGRENRSARTVQGPQRVVRTVHVPQGGGRSRPSSRRSKTTSWCGSRSTDRRRRRWSMRPAASGRRS